jgi:hypothetical protein
MTDQSNTNNEHVPRTYTEEEVLELFQRFRQEEQSVNQRSREERELPMEITSSLENVTRQQHQENFKRYKRDLGKYSHEEWTMGEEINKSFTQKLKNYTVDTTHVVNVCYKGAEVSRTHGRAATEIFEQLSALQSGNLSEMEAHQLLEEARENARRLAIHAWVQGKQHDEDAKDYAIKALKLPATLKHLEKREYGSKKEAFSTEFIEMYNEATYQQRVLRAATNNDSSNRGGRGGYSSSQSWNSYRGGGGGRGSFFQGRGKNYFGGRGRGNPTFNNNYNNNSHSTTQPPQQGNPNNSQ